MSFDGEALKLLSELSDQVLSNYSMLISELNRRYNPAERAQAWKIEFRNRSRLANESIIQYAQALKRLVSKAYPNMTSDAQEQWVLDQFTHGLGSVELRGHVLFGHPRDVNEAISLAIEYEAFQSGNKDKMRKPTNRFAEVNAVGSSPADKNDKQTYPKQSEKGNNFRTPNNADSSSSTDRNKAECRYCKKFGHVIQECRKLKWKKEQEAKRESENSASKAPAKPQNSEN